MATRSKSIADIVRQAKKLTKDAKAEAAIMGIFRDPERMKRARKVQEIAKRYINNIKNSKQYKNTTKSVIKRDYDGWRALGWDDKSAKNQSKLRAEWEASQEKHSRNSYMGLSNAEG